MMQKENEETKFGWAIVNLSPEKVEDAGFTQGAVRYLLEGGMTEEEVTALQQIICR